MKKTIRGFRIYSQIKDTYENKITVQESSAACGARCWIFVHNRDDQDGVWDEATGKWISAAAHLSPRQAKLIAKALLKFAEESERE